MCSLAKVKATTPTAAHWIPLIRMKARPRAGSSGIIGKRFACFISHRADRSNAAATAATRIAVSTVSVSRTYSESTIQSAPKPAKKMEPMARPRS